MPPARGRPHETTRMETTRHPEEHSETYCRDIICWHDGAVRHTEIPVSACKSGIRMQIGIRRLPEMH